MTPEKAEYSGICIGPGGRKCACCAPVSKYLKQLEHRKARRNKKRYIEDNVLANVNDYGYEQLEYDMERE